MKFLLMLTIAVALTLNVIFLNGVLAQDTISDCEQRCGIRTDTGSIVGNPQAIYACRERCSKQYWDKAEKPAKKGKGSSLFDD